MAAAKGNTYTQNRKINPQYKQEQIDDIIENLLEWANDDDSLYIATFAYVKYKQPDYWLYNLARSHENLKGALDVARSLIAGKIARHCFLGDRNSSFGERILPMYCKAYKEETKRKASLSKATSEDLQATADEFVKAIKEARLLDLLKQDDK